MKVKQTTEISIIHRHGGVIIISDFGITGPPKLVRLASTIKEDRIPGYVFDRYRAYAEHICNEFPEFSIRSSKYIEREYPDNTIF